MVYTVFEGTDRDAMERFQEELCRSVFSLHPTPEVTRQVRNDVRVSEVEAIPGHDGYFRMVVTWFKTDVSVKFLMVLDFDKAFKGRDDILSLHIEEHRTYKDFQPQTKGDL